MDSVSQKRTDRERRKIEREENLRKWTDRLRNKLQRWKER